MAQADQIDWDKVRNSDENVRLQHLLSLSPAQLQEVERNMQNLQKPSGAGAGKRFAKGLLKYGVGKPLQYAGKGIGKAAGWLTSGGTNPNTGDNDPFGNLGIDKMSMPKFGKGKAEIKAMDERFKEISKRINNPVVSSDIKASYTQSYDLWKRYRGKLKENDRRSRNWITYFNKALTKIEQAVGIMPAN